MEKPATSITHKVQLMISFNFYDSANIQVSWFCSVAGIFFHLSASLTNTLDSNRLPLSLYDSLSPAIQFVLLFLLTFSFPFTDFHWLLVIICMQLLKNSMTKWISLPLNGKQNSFEKKWTSIEECGGYGRKEEI